jgi:hypothetical protein
MRLGIQSLRRTAASTKKHQHNILNTASKSDRFLSARFKQGDGHLPFMHKAGKNEPQHLNQ